MVRPLGGAVLAVTLAASPVTAAPPADTILSVSARDRRVADDAAAGAREAARLARLAGRLEARAGIATPIRPAQETAR
jgi:hypothetical protein